MMTTPPKKDNQASGVKILVSRYETNQSEALNTKNNKLEEENAKFINDIPNTNTDIDLKDKGLISLSNLLKRDPRYLQTLDVSNNKLTSIDDLSYFINLKKIVAKNNSITSVYLKLPNLVELDLSDNQLTEIPTIYGRNNLQILRLGNNKIEFIRKKLEAFAETLVLLDISNNQLSVRTSKEFREIIAQFSALSSIEEIQMLGNPILQEFPPIWCIIVKRYIIRKLDHDLRTFNNEQLTKAKIKKIREENLVSEDEVQASMFNISGQGGDGETKQTKIASYMNTENSKILQALLENLENASSNPVTCLDSIAIISTIVSKLINMPEKDWAEIFCARDERGDVDINNDIDMIFENFTILIENQANIQPPLITCLTKLSIIPTHGFGQRCLSVLGTLLRESISRQLQNLVRKKLEVFVLPYLKHKKIVRIPISILEGLNSIMQKTEIGSFFTSICHYFIEWIKDIQLTTEQRYESEVTSVRKQHENALELISRATLNKDVTTELLKLGLAKYLNSLFFTINRIEGKVKTEDTQQLLYLLQIVQNSASLDDETAKSYLESTAYKTSILTELKKLLRKWMATFESNDFTLETETDTVGTVKLNYEFFSALISTTSTLIQHLPHAKLMEDLNLFGYKLLAYAKLDQVDPLVLTAICEFAYNVLNSRVGRASNTCVENVFTSMKELNPLLPYMADSYAGGANNKYTYLCRAASRYDKGAILKNEPVPLEAMTNSVVFRLIISILRLIGFVSEYSNKSDSHIKDKCTYYASQLNKNGREAILFNCLRIPNDEVKLAVVRCLDEVSISEIEVDELAYFSRLLSSYKILGAGRTEEVLSMIFLIMTKVLRDTAPSSKEFVAKYAKNCIADSLNILERNMQRNLVHELEEENEKMMLSVSCVHFLKVASKHLTIRTHMLDENASSAMKRTLHYEELYMTENSVPIDIENTHIGKSLENLLMCLETLDPTSIVFYRVIRRVAEILMAEDSLKDYEKDLVVASMKGEEGIRTLKENALTQFHKKLKKEVDNWTQKERPRLRDNKKETEINSEIDNLTQSHKLLSTTDGLTKLIDLIIKKKKKDAPRFKLYLNQAKMKFSQKWLGHKQQQQNKKEDGKEGGQEKQQIKIEKMKLGDKIEAELQRYQIKTKNAHRTEIKRMLLEPPHSFKNPGSQNDKKEEANQFDCHNMKLRDMLPTPKLTNEKRIRIFILSATMEVIRATFDFYIEPETRAEAIVQMKSLKNLLPLTEMCSELGWGQAHIGTKYLYLMKALLEEITEHNENTLLDIFELFSKAILEIIQSIQEKILNFQNSTIDIEDYQMINNLASCCSLICSYTASMDLGLSGTKTHVNKPLLHSTHHSHHYHGAERSPREKTTEFLLSRLIPPTVLYILLDVLFINMAKYASTDEKFESQEYDFTENTSKAISDLLGEYLSVCKDSKYEILKYFCKAEIANKTVRQTFLQEILLKGDDIRLRNALQFYIKDKGYIDPKDSSEVLSGIHKVEALEEKSKQWSRKIIAYSNKALYIFTPQSGKPCSICPPENFCPEGPSLDFRIEFANIGHCRNFRWVPRIGIAFEAKETKAWRLFSKGQPKEHRFIFSFNDSYGKSVMVQHLRRYHTKIEDDSLAIGALNFRLNKLLGQNEFVTLVHIVNHDKVVHLDEFYKEKKIVIIDDTNLYVFTENSQFWRVENRTEMPEDVHGKVEGHENIISVQLDDWNKARLNLFTEWKRVSLDSIKSFYVERNDIPVIEIHTDIVKLRLLFGTDTFREKFQLELFKRTGRSKFEKKTQSYTYS